MCGITGWVDWERELAGEERILAAMAGTLAHRGPDAGGTWLAGHAAIGHRRLSVIDIAGGAQPMVRRRGTDTYVISYNGELYNTDELRHDLLARGYTFQGHSDTEVLLAAYMEWGPACTERLNGIFAFAVWHEAAQSLFLARDQLGVKPLFYTRRGNSLIFGSELKAILAHPAVPPQVDADGLAEIFVIGPGRTPGHGVFKGVKELRPGWWLLATPDHMQMRQYWSLVSAPHSDNLAVTAAKVRELLADTVTRQLVSDVPLCSLLSGGLDSSAVSAFAQAELRQRGHNLITYSIDYAGNDKHFTPNEFQPNADGPWIKLMQEKLGTTHRAVTVDTSGLVEALKVALRGRDMPGMVDVDASLYLFCQEVKKGATVALSGEAADEIFGGYPWFHRREAINGHTFPWSRLIKERSRLLSPALREAIKPEQYLAERYRDALAEVPRLPGEEPQEARLREISYLNITRFMAILLERMDRMSMAVGLEVRVPFCDPRLVSYVWNIPWHMKNTGHQAKGILRLAMQGGLPPQVLARRKSPYPKTHNPAYRQAVQAWLAEIIADPSSPLLPLVDKQTVEQVVHTGATAYDPAWFSQLMGGPQLLAFLAQTDLWLREYHVQVV